MLQKSHLEDIQADMQSIVETPVPVRNKTTARACVTTFGSQGARIIFLHNRKAGGTTMRRWLGQQQICHQRFVAFVEESNVFDATLLAERGTLFISVIRAPISRILSSYRFEGQGSFPEWAAKVSRERKRRSENGRIWEEVQNYYIQRFSGYRWRGGGPVWTPKERSALNGAGTPKEGAAAAGSMPLAMIPDWEVLYHRALRVMLQFDVVFVTEELSEQSTLEYGAALMGVDIATYQPPPPATTKAAASVWRHSGVGHNLLLDDTGTAAPAASTTTAPPLPPPLRFDHKRPPRGPRFEGLVVAASANLSSSDLALLHEWNLWDEKLFEAAKAKALRDRAAAFTLLARLAQPTSRTMATPTTKTLSERPEPQLLLRSSCASDLERQWFEPISRLKSRVTC